MNEELAKSLLGKPEKGTHALCEAQGYLAAIEKAKVLEEALRFIRTGMFDHNSYGVAKEALAKWEKEK